MQAFRRRADDDLLVEAPQVLERAAAAGDDQQIRPRDFSPGFERIESVDRARHFRGRSFALDAHRPNQNMDGKPIRQSMQDVANHGPAGRGHHADDARHIGKQSLARGIEQALRRQLAATRLEQRHQRADARRLDRFDDDLIRRLVGECRDPACGDDLEPLLGLDPHPQEGASPDDGVEARACVFQAEIDVPRRMRPAISRDFAPHPDIGETILQRASERVRQIGDGNFRRVRGDDRRFGHPGVMPYARLGNQCIGSRELAPKRKTS